MTQFEYLLGTMDPAGACTIDGETITIHELGSTGWELISVSDWVPATDVEVREIQGYSVPFFTTRGIIARVVFKRGVAL